MGKAFGWLAAVCVAVSVAGVADAAPLALEQVLPLHFHELSPVASVAPQTGARPGPAVSEMVFSKVPEPSTLALLTAGLVGLSLVGRRQIA